MRDRSCLESLVALQDHCREIVTLIDPSIQSGPRILGIPEAILARVAEEVKALGIAEECSPISLTSRLVASVEPGTLPREFLIGHTCSFYGEPLDVILAGGSHESGPHGGLRILLARTKQELWEQFAEVAQRYLGEWVDGLQNQIEQITRLEGLEPRLDAKLATTLAEYCDIRLKNDPQKKRIIQLACDIERDLELSTTLKTRNPDRNPVYERLKAAKQKQRPLYEKAQRMLSEWKEKERQVSN